jgi:hypothetical protein
MDPTATANTSRTVLSLRLVRPNTLEANRKGRLPYIPGRCERRPGWLIDAQAPKPAEAEIPRNVARLLRPPATPADTMIIVRHAETP